MNFCAKIGMRIKTTKRVILEITAIKSRKLIKRDYDVDFIRKTLIMVGV